MGKMNRRAFVGGGVATALSLSAPAFARAQGSTPIAGTPGATPMSTEPVTGPLKELAEKLHGQLLLPGNSDYWSASEPQNGRFRGTWPLAVAQCADEADIVACVNWARENGVPPVARTGGHSEAGYSATDGLLINVGAMNKVTIDRQTGMTAMGGGAKNQDVLNAAQDSPHYLPQGTCLDVGYAALTLGGGIGYNTHHVGLAADHLVSTRIVTADGNVLDVDASHHSDLFWACRGGAGGNFGINASFTFQAIEVPMPTVIFYRIDWNGADDATAGFAAYHKLLQNAPDALNSTAAAQAVPVGAGGPRAAITAFSRGQYFGTEDELRQVIAPLLAAAKPAKVTIQEMKFWDMQRMFGSTDAPITHSYGDYSRFADKPLPDDATAKLIDLLVDCPSRTDTANGSIWSLGWIGGEFMHKIGRTETAYVHRNMMTLLRPTPVWPNDAPASVANDLIAWTDDVIALLTPYTPNESYQNFTNRRIIDWRKEYYAENFDRLVDVKTTYDPKNLFHNFQSIPPRSLL